VLGTVMWPRRKASAPGANGASAKAASATTASINPASATTAASCRGLTLVELLISVALSLFLIAGGIGVLASHGQDHRQLVLEARLMQELQGAAQAITRDLRRAGHWGDATAGLWYPDAEARSNPYQAWPASGSASDALALSYSRDASENHSLDASEQFGVRLRAQGIDLLLGNGTWQAITDTSTVIVTRLHLSTRLSEEFGACDLPCPPEAPGQVLCPPRLQVRHVTVEIAGRSPLDARLQRSLSTSARVRNDLLVGRCPA
jgi:prepilin peptidase dependent protein B